MQTGLSRIYNAIDRLLAIMAALGAVAMVALTLITVYDVMTRYFSIPKFPGINSTMVQESEYWAHAILFSLVMAYAITKQVHVRIDLVRDMLPKRAKLVLEIIGICIFLLPFSYISARYCFDYMMISYRSGEVSPSTIGLSHIWVLKSMLVVMFGSLFLAGVSQLLKCVDALRGNMTDEESSAILGAGHS